MEKIRFKIKTQSILTLEYTSGATSKFVCCDIAVSTEGVDEKQFINPDGTPTQSGTRAFTQAFIQGLAANLHHAHENNYWDSADHLRYIISELERSFVQVPNITKGEIE